MSDGTTRRVPGMVGGQGKQFPRTIILPEYIDGRSERGKAGDDA